MSSIIAGRFDTQEQDKSARDADKGAAAGGGMGAVVGAAVGLATVPIAGGGDSWKMTERQSGAIDSHTILMSAARCVRDIV